MLSKALLFFVLITAVSFLCPSISAQEKKAASQYRGSIRGETYSYKYTAQDFAETASWKAEDGEPPLSLSRALQAARTNLPRFVESSENWKVRRVHLQTVNEDKWFYNISFFCSGAPCRNLETRQFSIIVKMDGSILEPKKVVTIGSVFNRPKMFKASCSI